MNMYIEINNGYFYIAIWRFVLYGKRRGAVRISFIEMSKGVVIGQWLFRFLLERGK